WPEPASSPAGPPLGTEPIFFPFPGGNRATRWERGAQPMTRFSFPAEPDRYGLPTGQVDIAVPRFRDPRVTVAPGAVAQPYLATAQATQYAQRDEPELYVVDRIARTTTHEVVNDGRCSASGLHDTVLTGSGADGVSLRVISQTHAFYDGDAFVGRP